MSTNTKGARSHASVETVADINRWSGCGRGGRVEGVGVWQQNRGEYIHRAPSRPRRGSVCRPCRCGPAGFGPRCAKRRERWAPGPARRRTPFARPSFAWSSVWRKSRATHGDQSKSVAETAVRSGFVAAGYPAAFSLNTCF